MHQANMDEATQECTSRQNDSTRGDLLTFARLDTANPRPLDEEAIDMRLLEVEPSLAFDHLLHAAPV